MPLELLALAIWMGFLLHALRLPSRLGLDKARWFNAGLRTSALAHGFQFERRRPRSPVAVGRRGDYEVRVELRSFGGREDEAAHDDLHVSLTCLRLPQRVGFSVERGGAADVLTGDARFDDAVEVRGDPTILAALLDEALRLRLRKLVAWDGSLQDGQLSWQAPVDFADAEVPRTLMELVELADLLTAAKGGICERLARNALEEASPGVRLWNLTLLRQHFAARPETFTASRTGLEDSSPWIRLAAARFLPDEGSDALKVLLEDRQTPDHAASEAAALLAARLSADEAGPLLVRHLKRWSGETRRQVIQELGRLRHFPAVSPLCVLLERSDPRTGGAAAEALGLIGDPKAEESLLDAVQQDAAELRIAAARALGALGTVRAVEPLLERLAAKRIEGESRKALREAVSTIQSRLAGAEAGQLSLATPAAEAGRLSLATPKAGRGDMSLVDDPDRSEPSSNPC